MAITTGLRFGCSEWIFRMWYWFWGQQFHPRRRRVTGEGEFIPGWMERGFLLCQSGTLEFVAKVVKVFRADLHLQDFFDHRREVG
jgi:hypothetical protein